MNKKNYNANKKTSALGESFWLEGTQTSSRILLAAIIFSPLFWLLIYTVRIFSNLRIALLHHQSIGRLASHTEFYLRQKAMSDGSDNDSVIFVSGKPFNYFLLKLFSRKIRIIKNDVLWSILYLIRSWSLDNSVWYILNRSGFDQREIWFLPGPQIRFSPEDHQKGKSLLRSLGIPEGSEYVCFHARDREYKDNPNAKIDTKGFWYTNDFRYCHEQNFLKAAEYLAKNGIYVIRFALSVERPLDSKNPFILDYPINIRPNLDDAEFADIYLPGNCKFFLGNTSGIYLFSSIFGVPNAYTNMIPICDNGRTPQDIFIPRKYFHSKTNKYFKYREILDRGWDKDTLTQQQLEELSSDGITVIENTPDEILDVAIEMNERIDSTWENQADEIELMENYRKIFPIGHHMRSFPGRVGINFLRENSELLGGS